VRIELRAVLLPAQGSDMLARRAFARNGRLPAADARGGAGAAREAALAVADEIAAWTNDLARDKARPRRALPELITTRKGPTHEQSLRQPAGQEPGELCSVDAA
jgi:hypothetical protein